MDFKPLDMINGTSAAIRWFHCGHPIVRRRSCGPESLSGRLFGVRVVEALDSTSVDLRQVESLEKASGIQHRCWTMHLH